MKTLITLFVLTILAWHIIAHPGEDIRVESQKRAEQLNHFPRRTLASCVGKLEEGGHYKRDLARRIDKTNSLRASRGSTPLSARDLDSTSVRGGFLAGNILARQERPGCLADPEVTEGPFWVAGELIRSDIREGAPGVELHLDVNVVDVTTCQPLPDVFVEIWGANSTGVYSGVVSSANGAGLAAPEELNSSALRGVQATNENGTASFVTIVPGHYTGRANHLHTIVHHGSTVLPNNTIQGGTISHVGQFYIEPSLLQTIEATSPYNSNTQQWVQNAADMIFNMGTANGDNPIVEITGLGATVEEGLYGFIDVGVDPSANRNPSPVNFWSETGGVSNAQSPWTGYPWIGRVLALLRRWF